MAGRTIVSAPCTIVASRQTALRPVGLRGAGGEGPRARGDAGGGGYWPPRWNTGGGLYNLGTEVFF